MPLLFDNYLSNQLVDDVLCRKRVFLLSFLSLFIIFIHTDFSVGNPLTAKPVAVYEKSFKKLVEEGIHNVSLIQLTEEMKTYGFSDHEIATIYLLLLEALDHHLSFSLLENKLYEGMVKNVSYDKLLAALERMKERYIHAHTALKEFELKERYHYDLTRKIVDSLAAGFSKKDIDQLMKWLGKYSATQRSRQKVMLINEFLITARMLLQCGISSSKTMAVMSHAITGGFTPEELVHFRSEFENHLKNRGFSGAFNFLERKIKYRHGSENPVPQKGNGGSKGTGSENTDNSGNHKKQKGKGP